MHVVNTAKVQELLILHAWMVLEAGRTLSMQAKTLATLAGAEMRKSERKAGDGALPIETSRRQGCTCMRIAALVQTSMPTCINAAIGSLLDPQNHCQRAVHMRARCTDG